MTKVFGCLITGINILVLLFIPIFAYITFTNTNNWALLLLWIYTVPFQLIIATAFFILIIKIVVVISNNVEVSFIKYSYYLFTVIVVCILVAIGVFIYYGI